MFRGLNARIRHMMGGDDPPEPNQPVLLVEAATQMEAEVVRGKLEAFGITAYARDAGSSAAWAPSIGRWEVTVRHRDFVRAQQVLAAGAPDGEGSQDDADRGAG